MSPTTKRRTAVCLHIGSCLKPLHFLLARLDRPRLSPPPPSRPEPVGGGPAYSTPIYNKDRDAPPPLPPPEPPRDPVPRDPIPSTSAAKAPTEDDNLDEFDDLTIEELKSLLDNFKNLSKGEQMDLIRYMKKLEQNDPEKVKLLKQSVKPGQKTSSSR